MQEGMQRNRGWGAAFILHWRIVLALSANRKPARAMSRAGAGAIVEAHPLFWSPVVSLSPLCLNPPFLHRRSLLLPLSCRAYYDVTQGRAGQQGDPARLTLPPPSLPSWTRANCVLGGGGGSFLLNRKPGGGGGVAIELISEQQSPSCYPCL
jgi:hypothetical protein